MSVDKQQIGQSIAALCREFPNCFVLFERRRQPLKIGISADQCSPRRSDRPQAPGLGAAALHRKSLPQKAGVLRIDLGGNAAGTVLEADAASAAREVATRTAAFAERQRSAPSAGLLVQSAAIASYLLVNRLGKYAVRHLRPRLWRGDAALCRARA